MNYKKTSLLLTFCIFASTGIHAQQKTVTGIITDEKGSPLPGVNVVVAGTSPPRGTATDFDGKYAIAVSPGEKLRFTYVGYEAVALTVGGKRVLNVALAPVRNRLNEVVVTAIGIKRERRSLGYSAPALNGEALAGAQYDNVMAALNGKVAGLQITSPSGNLGGSQRILIRGVHSLMGNNLPLFVVDGIPMSNANFNTYSTQRGALGVDYGDVMCDIDPDNIESATVLKGSATMLYGARAANGVVLIKTKRGQSAEKKLGVSIHSSVSIHSVSTLPKLQRLYGGGSIYTGKHSKDGFQLVEISGKAYKIPQYATDESWGPKYDPDQRVLMWDAFDPAGYPKDYLTPRPWVAPKADVRDFYKPGIDMRNNIAVNGAGADGSYRLNFATNRSLGTVPNTEVADFTTGFSTTRKLTEDLQVDGLITYTRTEGTRAYMGYNSPSCNFFQWGHRQLDYNRLKRYKNPDGSQRSWNRTDWNNPKPAYWDNSYWTAYENAPHDARSRVYGKLSAQYRLSDDFHIKGTLNADTYNQRIEEKRAVDSHDQPFYSLETYEHYEFNYELIASWSRDISDRFTLGALAGGNLRRNQLKHVFASTTGGLSVPGIYTLANSKGPLITHDALHADQYTHKKNVNSILAELKAGFYDQLYLDLSARNDWSSTLPNDNNSYFYSSAAASWVFSELLKEPAWLSYGKLRTSWAQTGNDISIYEPNFYAVQSTYEYLDPFGGQTRLSTRRAKNNDRLKAETTNTYELGLESAFLQNRVRADFTYYSSKTTDQIMPVAISTAAGYRRMYINAGELTNKGVEVTLGLTPVHTADLKWDITTNFSKNENRVVSLAPDVDNVLLGDAPFKVSVRAAKGMAYGQLYGHDYLYSEGEKVIDAATGFYAGTKDLVPLGSYLPDWNGSITNRVKFKNFDFSFQIDRQKGGKYYSTSYMFGMYSGVLKESADSDIREKGMVLDGVAGSKNDDGTYAILKKPNTRRIQGKDYAKAHYANVDAIDIFDADYWKLRQVTIGYTLPQDLIDFVDRIRISLFGRNLFTWGLDYDGIDPETISGGSGNIQGMEGALQPAVRTYGISLNMSF